MCWDNYIPGSFFYETIKRNVVKLDMQLFYDPQYQVGLHFGDLEYIDYAPVLECNLQDNTLWYSVPHSNLTDDMLILVSSLHWKLARKSPILARADSQRACLWGWSLGIVPHGMYVMSTRDGQIRFGYDTSNYSTSTILTERGGIYNTVPSPKRHSNCDENRTHGKLETRPSPAI